MYFFYLKITPFSEGFIGVIGFIVVIITNMVCFASLYHFGKKNKVSFFFRYDSIKNRRWEGGVYATLAKSKEGNNIFLGTCFVLVWLGAMIYAPGNLYRTEFKPNVISWLDQGKCEEIKKYEVQLVDFCTTISKARKNLTGSFVVLSKNLNANATGCTYMLQSNNNGMYVVTTKPQTCDIPQSQIAFVTVHPFLVSNDRSGSDEYKYSTEVSLVP